jgi:hypothetical protein
LGFVRIQPLKITEQISELKRILKSLELSLRSSENTRRYISESRYGELLVLRGGVSCFVGSLGNEYRFSFHVLLLEEISKRGSNCFGVFKAEKGTDDVVF